MRESKVKYNIHVNSMIYSPRALAPHTITSEAIQLYGDMYFDNGEGQYISSSSKTFDEFKDSTASTKCYRPKTKL